MTKSQTQLPLEIPNRLVDISNDDCDIIIITAIQLYCRQVLRILAKKKSWILGQQNAGLAEQVLAQGAYSHLHLFMSESLTSKHSRSGT